MEKINVAELLKDCPKGMELDCVMYDNLYFKCIREHPIYPIVCYTIDSKGEEYEISFNWYGKYAMIDTSKCIIFPKGKTTWEGFVPPCKFKDGDMLATDLGSVFYLNTRLNTDEVYGCYVGIGGDGSFHICEPFAYKECCGLASEEEKEKLFQAIKDNGYRWNTETKELEELINMEDKEINNFNVFPGLYKCVHRMFDGTPDGKLLFEVGNIYRCLSKHDRAEFEVSWGHSIYLEDPVVCKHFIPFEKQGEQKSNPCEKCNYVMLNCHNFPCIKKQAFDQNKTIFDIINKEK